MTSDPDRARLPRCCAVWLTVTGLVAALTAALRPRRWAAPGLPGTGFDDVLVLAGEIALLACAGWCWAVTTVVALDAARGRSRRRVGVPAPLRRVLLAGCGTAVLGALVPAAAAAPGGDPARPGVAVVHGLPLPDRTTVRASSPEASRQRGRSDPSTTVVGRGDTLWAIAAADLPTEAGDARIARRWREIYRANRSVIGPDPDLIHPHQRLRLPRR